MSTRIEQLQERVEKLPPRMVEHYRVRLDALICNRAKQDAFDQFERKLAIAEDLGRPRQRALGRIYTA